jgi:predicted ArsR family transcriptional regulator
MWLVSSGARPGGRAPTAYAQLGRWLARAIKPGKTTLRDVESTGREIGRQLAPAAGGDAESNMYATLASLGFEPMRESHLPQRLTYRLRNCPYRDAAAESPDVVCGLHRGVTLGLLDELESSTELEAFVPRDPARAGCLIELSGPLAEAGVNRVEALQR